MLFAFQSVTYGQTVSIDPAAIESPATGEQLTLNINIVGGTNVAGYEVTVTFDSTALSYVSITNGDYLPAGAFAVPPGCYRYEWRNSLQLLLVVQQMGMAYLPR